VRNPLHRLFEQPGARNRTRCVAFARRAGLLDEGIRASR
jgi:hypothetical protein